MGDPLFTPVTDDNQEQIDFDTVRERFLKEDGTIDTEALIKKAAHADAHIGRLEKKLDEKNMEHTQSLTYEAIMAEIKALKAASKHDPLDLEERALEPTEIKPVDIEKLVDDRLNQKQKESLQQRNVDYVSNELTKVWGTNFQVKVTERAKELGIDQETLRNIAINNPTGFLNIIVPANVKPVQPDYTPPRSRQNIQQTSQKRNWKHFENIRMTDKKKYWSPAVQDELHKEAIRQGEAFFQNE